MAKEPDGPGIYSATYSGIPVYEYQFGVDLKEHVMRRRQDDWINATHILKAAGFDKPARTRILEREVQKDTHEKIQGGYGKYQGTWIPLERGEALAHRNNVYERLRPIFEYVPGNVSPPPAPRHASKAKAPRARPAVPKWTAAAAAAAAAAAGMGGGGGGPLSLAGDDFDSTDMALNDDDTPDNLTVASASYADDDQSLAGFGHGTGTGPRKRKREELLQDLTEQQHSVYGDELLDYFLLSRNEQPAIRPEPPTNFQPNWIIDTEGHTALHWACAMGDVDVVRQLKRFGAGLAVQNERGETPMMRAVSFTNCYEKQTFPTILRELLETVDARDKSGCTILHHAAIMKSGRVTSQSCARYYLDHLLNRLLETHDPAFVQQLLDAQDHDGNTAVHLAALKHATKCVRALLGRGASTDIANHDGVRAEDLIRQLNAQKKGRAAAAANTAQPLRSSSPFAPDSQRRLGFRDLEGGAGPVGGSGPLDSKIPNGTPPSASFQSEAAATMHARIAPLLLEKVQDLAQSYDEDVREKADAEKEARRILSKTQAELAGVRAALAELEGRIEPDEAAAKAAAEAVAARAHLLQLLARRNQLLVAEAVEQAEQQGDQNAPNGSADPDPDAAQLALARELHQLVCAQRQAEADYVDALAAVGTSDNIEKYRRLLRSCLGPEADSLEENLDGILAMMEEEVADGLGGGADGGGNGNGNSNGNGNGIGGGAEPMEIAAI